MIVTIDEARVGHPSIKLDGMELAGMVKCATVSMKLQFWSWSFYPAPIWPRLRPFLATRL